jgi:hypothetical protein
MIRLIVAACALALMTAASAYADTTATTANGTWLASPGQSSIYQTHVGQPINADGTSNFKSNGKATIPVQFSLSRGTGPLVFDSIGSDTATDNDFSFLSFTPNATTTFAQVAKLAAAYAFTTGDCHTGSLRWQIRISQTEVVYIYYGAYPSFASCTGGDDQSGVNLIGQPDLRYDTTSVGGTFYDTYANAVALVGSAPILRASLVLESGYAGDQRLTLSSATVNDDTFVPAPSSPPAPTCDLPPATIKLTKIGGTSTGPVTEPVSIQPNDENGSFRVVDCKYMYNLSTSSLSGTGRYRVEAVVNGSVASGAAEFDLR